MRPPRVVVNAEISLGSGGFSHMSNGEAKSVNTARQGARHAAGVVSLSWVMRRTLLWVSIVGIAVISACLLYSVVNRANAGGADAAESGEDAALAAPDAAKVSL